MTRTQFRPGRIAAVLTLLALLLLATGQGGVARAQQPPPAATLLPGEEDGSFTDNEDPNDAGGPQRATAAAGPAQRSRALPCPFGAQVAVVPPGPSYPCPPCKPLPYYAGGPDAPAVVPVPLPPPYVPCVNPSIRAVQGAVNLANQVQAQSLRTLDAEILRRAFIERALWQMRGYVDDLAWRGHYAEARLLGVRHLDTAPSGPAATTRSLERWEYREYDQFGWLVYSTTQTVENRWRLVRLGTRWFVTNVEIYVQY